MFNQEVDLKRKRDFSDVLNATFAFIQQEFKPLFKTLFTYAGIPVLISAIMATFFMNDSMSNIIEMIKDPSSSQNANIGYQMKSLLFNLVQLITQIFITGITYCYISLYAEKGAKNFEPTEVWDKFIGLFGSLLGFNFINSFVLVLAFLALIIPFFYVMIPISFIIIIKVVEDKGYSDSFNRCFFLVKNHWWQSSALLFIGIIITGMISGIFSLPAASYGVTKGLLLQDVNFSTIPFVITSIASTIGGAIITPLSAIIVSVQYYSLVEHKDNASLLNKINNINSDTEIKNG